MSNSACHIWQLYNVPSIHCLIRFLSKENNWKLWKKIGFYRESACLKCQENDGAFFLADQTFMRDENTFEYVFWSQFESRSYAKLIRFSVKNMREWDLRQFYVNSLLQANLRWQLSIVLQRGCIAIAITWHGPSKAVRLWKKSESYFERW